MAKVSSDELKAAAETAPTVSSVTDPAILALIKDLQDQNAAFQAKFSAMENGKCPGAGLYKGADRGVQAPTPQGDIIESHVMREDTIMTPSDRFASGIIHSRVNH